MIQSGGVAYELARPVDLYGMMLSKQTAKRLLGALVRCFPTLIVAFLLPSGYGLNLPSSLGSFLGFLVSMPLGMLTVVAFTMLIYIAAFYTVSPKGVQMAGSTLADFFSGGLIPIVFFPTGLRVFAEITPFGSMQNLPIRIYSGNISGANAILGIILQLFWILVLFIIGKLWLSKTMKRIVIQGG